MSTNRQMKEYARQLYEANHLIRFLNHRSPAVFRVLWEAYLAAKQLFLPHTMEAIPLDPTSPILQVRRWSHPIPVGDGSVEPHILFFSYTGWSVSMVLDGLIGRALTLRGARVSYFTCGGILPLCYIQNSSSDVPPMPCGRCRAYSQSALSAFGFTSRQLRHLVSRREWTQIVAQVQFIPDDELATYAHDGIRFGYFATVSARCFLLTSRLENTPEMLLRIRQHILQGRLVHVAVQKLLEHDRPHKIILFNGIQVAEQVMIALAERIGISYVCTERGYLTNTYIGLEGAPVAYYPLDHLWETYQQQPLTDVETKELMIYLNQRRSGYRQRDNMWERVEEDAEILKQRLGLQPARPLLSVFTNLSGDTAVIDRDIGYKDVREWIDHLIIYFSRQPDIDLVFRIHPAETRMARYQPRETYGDYILGRHPDLPSNIKVVESESFLSSYTLIDLSDLVMVHSSTIGMEASVMGKPVMVAAKVHYRDKGFTYDVSSPDELVAMLDRWNGVSENLPPIDPDLARRYAYMLFFRAMLPLDEVMEETEYGRMRLKLTGWDDLREGRIAVIDTICDSILYGKPFVNPYLGC